MFVVDPNTSEINPYIKKTQTDHYQGQYLLNTDQSVENYSQRHRYFLFFKIERHNGYALKKINGHENDQSVQSGYSQSMNRYQEQRKGAYDSPYQLFRRIPGI